MRTISADKLVDMLYDNEFSVLCPLDEVSGVVDACPTVDAVAVTRCKDCEHAERYERADGTAGYYCGHPQNTFTYGERWDRVFKPAKEADDFCSYGERKDGAGHGKEEI
mgnify:CR=1 FL=1